VGRIVRHLYITVAKMLNRCTKRFNKILERRIKSENEDRNLRKEKR
jgi:hypothetical protein